ncbi:MAG TPA: acyl-CoA dehydrogenase family protein, partial [Opitutales bacterium]|nr:acyl-CoA dehydrogenase family protein [Opitutales bacterium]
MFVDCTPEQKDRQSVIRDYIDRNINPNADEWDASEEIPRAVFYALGSEGFLAPGLAPQFGGSGMDNVTLGILMEEMGKASVSVVSDLTVHGMCVEAIQRFATDPLRNHNLPRMAIGDTLGAFA